MTRIISGTAGGRRIATPPGSSTRPTSDRVREALFSRLEHQEVIADAAVLDLYAGSGALGLEAASRGARQVLLVESQAAAAKTIRANIAVIGHPGVTVRAETVERALSSSPPGGIRYDLVFIDPPYDVTEEALAAVLAALVGHEWLSDEATVVVERSSRSPEPTWPAGLDAFGDKKYGETRIWFAEPVEPADRLTP